MVFAAARIALSSRDGGSVSEMLTPASTSPRLQAGDLLAIEKRTYVVVRQTKREAVCREACRPLSREFSVPLQTALARRRRPPRKLPLTCELMAALRKDAVSDDDCRRAVHAAAAEGHLDAVERGTCRSALLIAAARNRPEAVRALLSRGASVEARGDAGVAALELASAAGHRSVVDELLTHTRGVAVDAKGSDGRTALMLSSAAGHLETCRTLCEWGASVEATVLRGASTCRDDSITLALRHKHWRVASLLAGYSTPGYWKRATRRSAALFGLWLDARRFHSTPLHALDGMSEARARALLRAGADVHAAEAEEPDAPSPLDVDGAPRARRRRRRERRRCAIVVLAARPWFSGNHHLFADAEKAATALVVAGALVGREHGGAQSHLLFELWVELILPQVIERHPALPHPDSSQVLDSPQRSAYRTIMDQVL